MDIRVIEDKILVKEIKKEEKKQEEGFVIPEKKSDSQLTGEVIAVGDGNKDVTMKVKVGDKVVFHKNGCYRLDLEDGEYLVLTQQQVLVII